tara:strand:+ start:4653 stop:5891 length:1239 start_codon:yes stop_codon:yes gene_type:complete
MGLKVEINFSNLPKNLIDTLRSSAQELGIDRMAIVGGVIRDSLIDLDVSENLQPPKDLDLVIEGSTIELAQMVQEKLGLTRVSISQENRAFQTIKMVVDGLFIDIARARAEKYSSPAENPKIEPTSIEEDLHRRDFTINAIALDLNTYKLIDLHGGLDALKKQELTFIHSHSVQEDPTRIIRGARYAARLNFHLSKESIHQIQATIKQWPWEWNPTHSEHLAPPALATRLRMELELLLENEPWEQALEFLQNWGGFLLLDKRLHKDQKWKKRIALALDLGLTPLTALIAGSSNPLSLSKRLQLAGKQQNLLKELDELQSFFKDIYFSKKYINWKPSDWCDAIENKNWHSNSIALAICLEIPLWESLLRWFNDWRMIKSPLSARDLIKKGWEPGPGLNEELKRLRRKKLNENN